MNSQDEILSGRRFGFGENWSRFLVVLTQERIDKAERGLKDMLDIADLKGKSFLDIGSGSGLSSLVAKRLGARVHSFDFDTQSVACTTELKRRYFADDADWIIETGSALDGTFMTKLGQFDVVYSWGVLHHTGAMWIGIEHAISRVKDGGTLFIAIYNDQGWKSHLWWFIKFVYNKLPRPANLAYAYTLGIFCELLNIIKYTLRFKPMTAIAPLLNYKAKRGMSMLHDMVDWMGGFPFEFATFETLANYMGTRGFDLVNGKPASSLGCHEMVFRRHSNPKTGDGRLAALLPRAEKVGGCPLS